jgi:hypothetical protein
MDNGAYSDFRWGRPFSTLDWDRDVRWLACAIAAGQLAPPDFTCQGPADLTASSSADVITRSAS